MGKNSREIGKYYFDVSKIFSIFATQNKTDVNY